MKRTKWLILCLLLCMTVTLGSTIAYLTDTDGDVNVMVLGNVSIELEEWERGENGLQSFTKDKMILPIVGNTNAKDSLGLPTNTAFLDKIVRVQCTSQHANAFLRVYIGLPSALLNVDGNRLDALHMMTGEGVAMPDITTPDSWPWREASEYHQRGVTIDGIKYDMLCYEYQPLLAPGDVTAPVLAGLWLDSRLDSADDRANYYAIAIDGVKKTLDYDFSNGLQVPVLAQAVQADGFDSAAAAFKSGGMNDVDFDKLLNLNVSVTVPPALENLLQAIKDAFSDASSNHRPTIFLTEETSNLDNSAFSQQLQTLSDKVPNNTEIELVPPDVEEYELNLGNTSLPDNVTLTTNDSNMLIIIGDPAPSDSQ